MIQTKFLKNTKEIINFVRELNQCDFNELECEQILQVFLTPTEIDAIAQRIQIVDLISQGIAQREISEKLGVGIATVTRGSRMLQEHPDILKRIFPKQNSIE